MPHTAIADLAAPPTAAGELIYTGQVVPEGKDVPAFRYERRVDRSESGWTSTHLTFVVDSSDVVLVQRAAHSSDYVLRFFEEVHGQTGVMSSVQVQEDGSLVFATTQGNKTKKRSEGPGAPVVVGPTLFGHVLKHWDELQSGKKLDVRFAATERARSYDFTLRLADATPETTTIIFEASSALVRMGLDPMQLVFDADTRKIRSYQGRVPPRLPGLRTFDALVGYEFASAVYY